MGPIVSSVDGLMIWLARLGMGWELYPSRKLLNWTFRLNCPQLAQFPSLPSQKSPQQRPHVTSTFPFSAPFYPERGERRRTGGLDWAGFQVTRRVGGRGRAKKGTGKWEINCRLDGGRLLHPNGRTPTLIVERKEGRLEK